MSNEMARPAGRSGWNRFEAAVYEYARECALLELEQEGQVGPPGGVWWALEYMPAFFEGFDKRIFEGVCVDTDYHRQQAEYHFLVAFRNGWRAARVPLSEEAAS
jgi:hypothetical protein